MFIYFKVTGYTHGVKKEKNKIPSNTTKLKN